MQKAWKYWRTHCNFEDDLENGPCIPPWKKSDIYREKVMHKTQKTRPELSKANFGKFATEKKKKKKSSAFSVVAGTFD